ncbi:MAG TPA: (2Fe-2S)-binding protein [Burkholderiales bacterium]|nr:(2Fe-2S)-binding protein [Burkholderiales bacterium]
MFVCVCNGVTERQVRQAIELGATSVAELTACLGVAAGCGTCAGFTEELLKDCVSGQNSALPQVA